MKRILEASLRSLLALSFVAVCGASAARAQINDARVIRARAGGVNFVSGDVSVRPADSKLWVGVSTRDELKTGDEVRTGADGRVEVLLNPGSYFRAGGATQFTMADASLEDLRLGMTRGSAVIEATGYSDLDLSITISTPRGVVSIVRSGVYRIDVNPSGVAEVEVLKGRAFVGTTLVKGGKAAREGANGLEVAKLDKKDRDALDQWSRDRGKELAKANEKLTRRGIYASLAGLSSDPFGGRSGNGLWLWNARASCYTFLPFNTYYWQSPYGYYYGTGAYYYPGSPGNGNSYGGGGSSTGGGGGSVVTAPGAGSSGGKTMPPHEISPPREMPQREMVTPTREMSSPAMSAPREMSSPSMSAPARSDEGLPQRNAPPE